MEKYDLKGKTVLPFCTSGGSIEEAMPAIQKVCRDAVILEGYTADGRFNTVRTGCR